MKFSNYYQNVCVFTTSVQEELDELMEAIDAFPLDPRSGRVEDHDLLALTRVGCEFLDVLGYFTLPVFNSTTWILRDEPNAVAMTYDQVCNPSRLLSMLVRNVSNEALAVAVNIAYPTWTLKQRLRDRVPVALPLIASSTAKIFNVPIPPFDYGQDISAVDRAILHFRGIARSRRLV